MTQQNCINYASALDITDAALHAPSCAMRPSVHRRCERCRQHRSPPYFVEDVAVCSACVLHATYQWAACVKCAQPHAVRELKAGEGQLVCYACSPAHWPYQCTSCKEWKAAAGFRASENGLDHQYHRRCKTCETCNACKTHFIDFRSFAADTQVCTKCDAVRKYKKVRRLHATAASEELSSEPDAPRYAQHDPALYGMSCVRHLPQTSRLPQF